ncbi:MAG: arsenate reductase (glutaredoxin) [Pseudomonadota bacterium]
MTVKIYHNPRCSKSRAALDLLRGKGVEPEIVEYLKTPPSAEELDSILSMLRKEPRDIMRKNEAEYKDNGLDDMSLSRSALIDAMVKNPKLIERPIVVADGKAALGRPPENVLEII